jgi:hypothetical protein
MTPLKLITLLAVAILAVGEGADLPSIKERQLSDGKQPSARCACYCAHLTPLYAVLQQGKARMRGSNSALL